MAVLLAALAAVAVTGFPTADDYCNSVLVRDSGVGGALHWLFFEWSGRLVTGAPLYTMFAFVDLTSLRWMSVALVCLLAVAAGQIGWMLAGEDVPLRWPLSAFVFAALVLGLYRLLGQAVLWSTGGVVYMLPLALALLWLASVRRLLQGNESRAGPALGFLLGVLTGDAIELVWPILVAYIALVAPSRWSALSSIARRGIVVRVIGLAAGMALLVVAPGNYVRAKVTPGSFSFEPFDLASHYIGMLKEIVVTAWPMATIIAAVAVTSMLASRKTSTADRLAAPSPRREAVALAIGALASAIPVLAAPPQFAPRNGFYMLIFALAAALIPLVAHARHARWRPLAAPALIGLAAIGTAIVSVPLVADARQSSEFRERQLARDRMLRELPRTGRADAIVAPIGVWPVPRTLHFVEVEPDPAQWNNVCMAKYYGLRSIALDRDGAR